MSKHKKLIILTIICILGFLTFSYKLGEIPNGIYLDEATTGYNAFSILKTGKDEYGKEFPLAFRFFGSYSPPLYTYLTVIPISIYSVNEFSVRITSVICAVLMIIIIYQFLKQSEHINKNIFYLLLILFILTPWNFFFARTGYEIYLGFFIFSLGTLLCWLGLQKKLLLIAGLACLSLATYASHSQIYSVPIFVVTFAYFLKQDKTFLTGLLLAFLIQIPRIPLLTTKVFLNKSDLFYSSEIIANADKIFLPSFIAIPLSFFFSFLAKFITYLSPYSLFLLQDSDPQRSIPTLSVFYNWMLIPYVIGFFILFKNLNHKFNKFLLLLIVTSIIPAALTKDPFSTQRGLNLLLPLFLIICMGTSFMYEKIKPKIFITGFMMLLLISLFSLWRGYFVFLPVERALAWSYGYKQIAGFISDNPNSRFVIEQIHNKPSYIELAFFLKTDPEILQASVNPEIKTDYYNNSKFTPDYKFQNIEVRRIIWEEDIYKPQILIGDELVVSSIQKEEHSLIEVLTVDDLRGYPVIKAYKTEPQKKCLKTNNASLFCKSFF